MALASLAQCLIAEPPEPIATFIFAHGAGAPMDSDFMERIATGLCAQGVRVVRFEFPYMVERRATGKRRPPNRQTELLAAYQAMVAQVKAKYAEPLFIGGKSMGGRMATLLAAELDAQVAGVICYGYPFHPQGKPEKLRIEHLPQLSVDCLVIQGDRDALGSRSEVEAYPLGKCVQIYWLVDGNHDLKPRVKSGYCYADHIQAAIDQSVKFIQAQRS